jgi:hypothetical protein
MVRLLRKLCPSPSAAERRVMRTPAMRLAIGFFVACLLLQGAYWWHIREIMPEMAIVPDVPGEQTVHALSFGDEEVFFRLYAFNLQNAGDTFGRFTALYKYDYNKLYRWFLLLDEFNAESNYLPALATYYFAQTQNHADVRYMVNYLDAYTLGREKEKWWWVVQAVYMAQHKVGDLQLAQKMADRLQGVHGIPIWAQQMPAFVHEARGEFGAALTIIEDILKHPEEYSESELTFMRYFVDERLGRLNEVEKEYEAAKKSKEEQRAQGKSDSHDISPPPDVGALEWPAPAPH